jgi:pantothenate kinase type III
MRLLADCGNTALKLAVLGPRGPEDLRRVPPDPVAIREAVAGASQLDVVAVSRSLLATLRSCWGDAWGIRVLGEDIPLPDCGQYPGMGQDRLVAGIAAVALHGDCLVIDCGTATTFTAWRGDGRKAQVLGGMILPGAAACAAGLQRLAPELPLVEPASSRASPVQRETEGAIAAALGIGYGAMIERCLDRLREETGIATVIATGGAARRWLPEADFVPDLVLRGLARLVEV